MNEIPTPQELLEELRGRIIALQVQRNEGADREMRQMVRAQTLQRAVNQAHEDYTQLEAKCEEQESKIAELTLELAQARSAALAGGIVQVDVGNGFHPAWIRPATEAPTTIEPVQS